jgi:hypothetical protein
MTLITAIIGGLACGYIFGLRRQAFIVWLAVWAVVIPVQTLFLVDPENRDDVSYWPVQAAIVVIAAVMIWLGAWMRGRLRLFRRSQDPS